MLLSRPKLVSLALLACGLLSCADEPAAAPAAVPEEFDDPFAEDEDPSDRTPPPSTEEASALPKPSDSSTPIPPDLAVGSTAVVAAGDKPEGPPASDTSSDGRPDSGRIEPRKTPRPKAPQTKPPQREPTAEPEREAPTPVVERPTPESLHEQAETLPATPSVEEPPAAEPSPEGRFVGTYRYAGGSVQRKRLEDAIDNGVSQLNPVIRGIGRRRLNESNQIRTQLTINVRGNVVTTSFKPGGTLTATLGAAAAPWTTGNGKSVKAKVNMVKGRFVQDFESDEGSRRSVFTLDSNGDKLTLSVTIRSDRLEEPVRYVLTYKRK